MTESLIGCALKHYRVESLIGAGGMGVVYTARDTRLDRPVAIKVLKPELVADPDRRARFLTEARTAAALTHPAIGQVYDIDEDGGTTFIAMEFIDGRTISRLIADGELDLLGSVDIALQVAEGLAQAHESGIIHRDIKSDNIMVTRDGHAKLLDFGLAKLLEAGTAAPGTPPGALDATLTMGQPHTLAGAVLGTIQYMSPEQARGQALDPRSDIFSLGIVLYQMVTGELPFRGESLIDTMHSIAYVDPKPVTIVRRSLPPQVHRVVARCLRKNRDDRYPDARELAADLKRLKFDLESGTRLGVTPLERLSGWIDMLKASIPGGNQGLFVLGAAILATVVLLLVKLQGGSLFSTAVIVYILYRWIRNRRKRMLHSFVKKASAFPEVRAVFIRDDQVTVVMDPGPAKTYVKINGLIDSINDKAHFGAPIKAALRDDLAESEVQSLRRTSSLVYARDDALPGLRRPENKA
jgi:serine/threonine protein kinase